MTKKELSPHRKVIPSLYQAREHGQYYFPQEYHLLRESQHHHDERRSHYHHRIIDHLKRAVERQSEFIEKINNSIKELAEIQQKTEGNPTYKQSQNEFFSQRKTNLSPSKPQSSLKSFETRGKNLKMRHRSTSPMRTNRFRPDRSNNNSAMVTGESFMSKTSRENDQKLDQSQDLSSINDEEQTDREDRETLRKHYWSRLQWQMNLFGIPVLGKPPNLPNLPIANHLQLMRQKQQQNVLSDKKKSAKLKLFKKMLANTADLEH